MKSKGFLILLVAAALRWCPSCHAQNLSKEPLETMILMLRTAIDMLNDHNVTLSTLVDQNKKLWAELNDQKATLSTVVDQNQKLRDDVNALNRTLLGPNYGVTSGPAEVEEIPRHHNLFGSIIHSSNLFPLEKAIDDDPNTFSHSTTTFQPWWLIDLGRQRVIQKVTILPRQDTCCWVNFRDIEIRVGDSLITDGDLSAYKLMFTFVGPYTPEDGRLTFSSREGFSGRYLSIQRMNPLSTLEIADVKVFVTI